MILLYVAAVAAANIVTAATSPADIGPFLVTWGTWFAAVTFVLRDVIQLRHGRRVAYAAIGAGLAVAAVSSALLGDTEAVVVASAVAFGLSESLDTEVFTRLKASLPWRVGVSGVVGGALDTSVFVILGLSPLWSGIIPWSAVPNAILGVWLAKCLVQALAAVSWRALEPTLIRTRAA
jgi:uncharacterized PurR-regulated membrane protein YhhQ (DUF165 family)